MVFTFSLRKLGSMLLYSFLRDDLVNHLGLEFAASFGDHEDRCDP